MTVRVLILALALAAPATAQDLGFSPAATEACLARDSSSVTCIGVSAAACIAGPDGGSNAGMGACWSREADYWQTRLDATYEGLAAQAADGDSSLQQMGSAAMRQGPALEAMRAAFDAYREALCLYEATTWGGGSGAGPASQHCWMMVTGMQALMLESGLELH